MEETLKFCLKSKLAIIKKPDSNETYYTYNFPHKIMLLGLLGAIIGLNGYNSESFISYMHNEKAKLPEFYTKLKELQIAIIPNFESKGFNKKLQQFNNSVGYASEEQGNNLIVCEQIIENPSWDIFILNNNSKEYEKIKEYLINKKCEYIPYIGKNEYFANIDDVQLSSLEEVSNASKIDSIFDSKIVSEYIKGYIKMLAFDTNSDTEYEFSEILPTKLDLNLGYTEYRKFVYTNKDVKIFDSIKLYKFDGKILYFF